MNLTGKAKAERECRKWSKLEDMREEKEIRLENKKEKARIEEEKKRKEEQNRYIELLKEDFDCRASFTVSLKKYYSSEINRNT